MATEREILAEELGYWPASTDPEHIAMLRAQNEHYETLIEQDPEGTKWQKMMGSRDERDF